MKLKNELKKEFTLGAIKNKFARGGAYLGIINMLLLIINLSLSLDLDFFYTLLLIGLSLLIFVFITIFDALFILSSECKYTTQKNPVIMEILKEVKNIKKGIKKI